MYRCRFSCIVAFFVNKSNTALVFLTFLLSERLVQREYYAKSWDVWVTNLSPPPLAKRIRLAWSAKASANNTQNPRVWSSFPGTVWTMKQPANDLTLTSGLATGTFISICFATSRACYTYHSMSAINIGWFLYRTMNIIMHFVKI